MAINVWEDSDTNINLKHLLAAGNNNIVECRSIQTEISTPIFFVNEKYCIESVVKSMTYINQMILWKYQ